jgi:crossover junction endodeoxyribonuclease RuvC
MRILGVDPGSRLTGYGCIDRVGNRVHLVTHGTLKLSPIPTTSFEDRLLALYVGLSEVIQQHKPQILVVEKVFFAKNALSALKLGQARGAIILTGKIHSLSIVEYSPNEVKQAVVGYGKADKEQVAKMVQIIIGQQKFATFDASDGLALAICHAQTINSGSIPSLKLLAKKRSKKRLSIAESVNLSATLRKKAEP